MSLFGHDYCVTQIYLCFYRMTGVMLCGLLALICVTSANVLREDEVVERIRRELPPTDGE